MYDIENRIVKINLYGEVFELLATTRATTKVGAYFADEKLTGKNIDTDAGYNAVYKSKKVDVETEASKN